MQLGNFRKHVLPSIALTCVRKSIISAAILLIGFSVFVQSGAAPMQNAQMTLSSLMVKACIVAYDDFTKKINAQVGGPPELVAHVSNIDNYSVTVSEDDAHYVVVFLPKPLAGQTLKGGGARYTISKADFQIRDVVRFK